MSARTQHNAAPTGTTGTTAAALYLCCRRDRHRDDSEDRARVEGQEYAEQHGLTIIDTIRDPYGQEHDPTQRPGWQHVMKLAEAGDIAFVLTRWPACVSPQHEQAYEADQTLRRYGAQVRYTWRYREVGPRP
ncbi:hypothetical protein ACIGW8_36860 [Streptomyces sioyaensis]|uniref:hypothetical protein n=1 Tax=Streptomyces sioyaensis TaxID=67364 RepID=UPI0037D7B0E7